MLVLSRQRDETIMIGDDIQITVVDIRGDKVRLGINAPAKVTVHRKEVYDAIKAENQRAAGAAVEMPSTIAASSPLQLGQRKQTLGRLAPLSSPAVDSSQVAGNISCARATGTDGPHLVTPVRNSGPSPGRPPERTSPRAT